MLHGGATIAKSLMQQKKGEGGFRDQSPVTFIIGSSGFEGSEEEPRAAEEVSRVRGGRAKEATKAPGKIEAAEIPTGPCNGCHQQKKKFPSTSPETHTESGGRGRLLVKTS